MIRPSLASRPSFARRNRARASTLRAWGCAALLSACAESAADEAGAVENYVPRDGDEALAHLLGGNRRFAAGESRHELEGVLRRSILVSGQQPYAIVLGCADSRVAPELVFDAGLGELFVIRVAGNVVGVDEAGSIEYAVAHLGTPLVVVLGHEGCGAVTAALQSHGESDLQELSWLIENIAPVVSDIDPTLTAAERVHLGVEANVRESLRRIHAIADRIDRRDPEDRRARFVGAVYELETGRVRLLEP